MQIEHALGDVSLSDKLLELANGDHLPAVSVQAVAEALAMVKTGTPVAAVNAFLGASIGGVVTDIDVTLGIDVAVMDNVQ